MQLLIVVFVIGKSQKVKIDFVDFHLLLILEVFLQIDQLLLCFCHLFHKVSNLFNDYKQTVINQV